MFSEAHIFSIFSYLCPRVMKEMQFTAMVLMSLLTLTLALLLPRRVAMDSVFGRSRWMMAGDAHHVRAAEDIEQLKS